jgi:hypothetical protein
MASVEDMAAHEALLDLIAQNSDGGPVWRRER